MDVNDNAFFLDERVALETIASKLAPTGGLPEGRVFGSGGYRPGWK
ncbi:hypothetical protein PS874_01379 [Pseudomonas fluorescens]|jgi:hypothetical protein|nr:hypothetical protein PS874_01379 [Pseudomonas fluorescens]